jgi:hypothetical protein
MKLKSCEPSNGSGVFEGPKLHKRSKGFKLIVSQNSLIYISRSNSFFKKISGCLNGHIYRYNIANVAIS